ncbi:MAG TPA: branched-chain amino acid ABC transporter permease [Mycobacteriales bacterium]|nr:branched-chain amino acid ABC transporter permease [Mycobacteriales bacterium]
MATLEGQAPASLGAGPVPVTGPLRYRRWVFLIALAVLLVAYPRVFVSGFAQNVGVNALTFAVAATGWNLLGGFTGQISFGHAMFFGAGMYTTAVFVMAGMSPWISMLPAAAVAATLGVLIGLPCFRLRGHYFSIATIAVGVILLTVVTDRTWLGGPEGLTLPIKDETLWNLQFSLRDLTEYYYVILAIFAVVTGLSFLFVRGRAGRYVRAIRDDDRAAAAVGVPVRRYKLIAVALSGGITALAGSFQVMHALFVDPPSALDLSLSIQIALIAVFGGAGSLWGPLLGGWSIIFVQSYSSVHWQTPGRPVDLLIYGALITIVAVVEPSGLAGLFRRGWRNGERWLATRRGGGVHRVTVTGDRR